MQRAPVRWQEAPRQRNRDGGRRGTDAEGNGDALEWREQPEGLEDESDGGRLTNGLIPSPGASPIACVVAICEPTQ